MSGPLDGALVVDASRALAGPHAAMMLGDLGARVIKVEPPGGDDSRAWGPPFVGPQAQGVSTYFLACNRNKESIALDLKAPADLATFRELLRRSDVLVENFRPGGLERLGLDHASLQGANPRLVILSITGFGHDGPEAHRAGYDQILQGEAGLMSLTGPDPAHPTKVGVPISDVLAGVHGALGVCSALYERERTGRGRIIRTSLLASTVAVHAFQGTRWTVGNDVPVAIGNHHPSISPYGTYRCADGGVQVAVGSHAQWQAFAAVIGLESDDPRFLDNGARVAHRQALNDAIDIALRSRLVADLLEQLSVAGVPAGEIRSLDQVYAWDQVESQGLVLDVHHERYGHVALPGSPLRFDANAYSGARETHRAPPLLGEHGSELRAWLGSPPAEPLTRER